MVTALSPQQFLAGDSSCGAPLSDVELRLGVDEALEVRTQRLAMGSWRDEQPDVLLPVANSTGWWRSGDRAQINGGLVIRGRLDTALSCGGETVFPEQLEARLMRELRVAGLPVECVLFLGMDDPEWGQRW
jgi:O-succinylbenzoic acid--CoA ligase